MDCCLIPSQSHPTAADVLGELDHGSSRVNAIRDVKTLQRFASSHATIYYRCTLEAHSPYFELNRSAVPDVGINVPTSAEPASPTGAAAYHDTAVWLKPAG